MNAPRRHPLHRPRLTLPAVLAIMLTLAGPSLAKEHLLGPTGMFGETGKAEIKVTQVQKGSPAEGVVKPGAVIVGAGKMFSGDPRKELAAAIDRAEAAAGRLTLTLKGGQTAELSLPVLGRYSPTAPYDCAKTRRIVTRIADKMLETRSHTKGQIVVGWLGLMATGEEKYLDEVRKELPKQAWVHPDPADHEALLAGEKDLGYVGWYWGYRLIVLGEYFKITGDTSVLPAMETYALTLARGQDPAGIWGHRLAIDARGGRLPGYAHINQPSLSCLIGMILAQKCGIDHPELEAAVEKSIGFYHTFAGEGAIPYGVHDPFTHIFNNNGSSAMAALAMALHGDRQAAAFFSHQAAAAHDILETGHATHYFNLLWTPLGAAVSGPEVTRKFFERARWLHTSYRGWDDVFTYDGGESKSCSSPGSLLLAYCLPRRQLLITGKGADESLWLEAGEAEAVVGASEIDYAKLSEDELIGLFGHPAPQVTRRAVWTLRERRGEFIPRLVALIEEGTDIEKRSAIGFFGYKCPEAWMRPQTERLGRVLADPGEPPKVRAAAAYALCWHGKPAHRYHDDMLRFVMEEKPDDPFGMVDKDLAKSLGILSENPFADGLVRDKELFYAAMEKLAGHPRQGTRAEAMKRLLHMPADDFPLLADTVKTVVKNNDPHSHSYHNPMSSVKQGAMLLAELGIEDGMTWGWEMYTAPGGKAGFKNRAILGILEAYGPHARPYLEKIRNDPQLMKALSSGRWKRMFDAFVKSVEQPTESLPELISFEAARTADGK